MSNKDTQILTLWAKLTEREKQEVLRQIQVKQNHERAKRDLKRCSDSSSERQTRQLRPIWQFALDTVNALGVVALFYMFVVATLLLV